MRLPVTHKPWLFLLGGVGVLVIFVIVQVLIITYSGSPVAVPNIPREPQSLGQGPTLSYVILGDSTAVGQGGEYERGIAMATTRHLAQKNTVTMRNVAVSGARMHDVRTKQLSEALKDRPDIVLISAGANDVTHLTSVSEVGKDMRRIIDDILTASPQVRIVITGSPAMGSVSRFPQPTKSLAGARTRQINSELLTVATEKHVTFAPIAEKTGPIFAQNPKLFAQDRFHPNTKGYDIWIPVLTNALDEATSSS